MEREHEASNDQSSLVSRGLAIAVERYRRLQEERERIRRRNVLAAEMVAILAPSEITLNDGPERPTPKQ